MNTIEWLSFFLAGWGSFFSAYSVLQVLMLLTLKRSWRYWALLPIPFMLWLLIVTLQAYHAHSNMWPILMIFISPLAALAVAIFLLIGLRVQAHPHKRALTLATIAIVLTACLPYVYMYLTFFKR
jgi:hypothetical protein